MIQQFHFGIYPDKTIIQKDTCTLMFIRALFATAKTWKQPKCLLTGEWIKKICYIYTKEYYSVIRKNGIIPFVLVFGKEKRKQILYHLISPHSSTLAWKIPWVEEPGRLQSMGSLRVRHDWATSLSLFTFMHWRRKWQPTPVFLPRESQGRGSLVGCRLWGRTESDTTEVT